VAKPRIEDTRNYKNIPDACIPSATSFTGDINTKAGVRIDGSIKGNVIAVGNVVIGPEGMVEGQVGGRDINIAGGVTGNVTSTATVQLLSGAKLLGDLEAVSLAIEEGATFKGKCTIGPADKGPLVSSARLVEKPGEPEKPAKA
jgi:cytoskeletal protein CcmA (bactofilin family)